VEGSGRTVRQARARLLATLTVVARDRTHGARQLSLRALRALQRAPSAAWGSSAPSRTEWATVLADRIGRTQPAMGTFVRWAAEWRTAAERVPAAELPRWSRSWCRQEKRRIERELPALLARAPIGRLRDRVVVTISRSETVERLLLRRPISVRPRLVRALESRPGGEGLRLAEALRHLGLAVRLVPDREGPQALLGADLLLIGADAVYRDGTVVHKVGTRRLASAAFAAKVPVVVVAGRSKWVDRPPPRRPPPGPFDLTPARWVREYWTDSGVQRGRARST